jgi:hypothetical protein
LGEDLRKDYFSKTRLHFGAGEWESRESGYPQDLRDLRELRRQMKY